MGTTSLFASFLIAVITTRPRVDNSNERKVTILTFGSGKRTTQQLAPSCLCTKSVQGNESILCPGGSVDFLKYKRGGIKRHIKQNTIIHLKTDKLETRNKFFQSLNALKCCAQSELKTTGPSIDCLPRRETNFNKTKRIDSPILFNHQLSLSVSVYVFANTINPLLAFLPRKGKTKEFF